MNCGARVGPITLKVSSLLYSLECSSAVVLKGKETVVSGKRCLFGRLLLLLLLLMTELVQIQGKRSTQGCEL